jgi:hypothetical protein
MSERDRLIWKAERAARVLGGSKALRIANDAIEPESPFFAWEDIPTRDLRVAVPSLTEEAREARKYGLSGVEARIPVWLAAAAALAAAVAAFAIIRTAEK